MSSRWNFDKLIKKFGRLKTEMATTAAVMAKNHFQDSFRHGGFTDNSFSPWKRRKRFYEMKRRGRAHGGIRSVKTDRALLISTGALKSSIKIKSKRPDMIRIVSDLGLPAGKDYAAVHNYGLKAGRRPGFVMPQRQFIGRSRKLEHSVRLMIYKKIQTLNG